MPTAPTLVSYTEVAWNTASTSKATASVSWNTGDIVVVIAGSENANADVVGGGVPDIPTATGLSFSSVAVSPNGNWGGTRLSTATAASNGSSAITTTMLSATCHWGFGVWVWRGSDGVGNSAEQHTATKTVSITPAQVDSAFMWGVFDFNADAAGSGTPAPSHTRQAAQDAGHYEFVVCDLADQTSASAASYGQSGGGTTGPFSILAVEVKGAASGGGGGTPTMGFAISGMRPNAFAPGLAR